MIHNYRILQLLTMTLTLTIIGALSKQEIVEEKRGLTWPELYGNSQDFNLFKNSTQVNWVYNRGTMSILGKPLNLEFVAMQSTKKKIDTLHNDMIYNQAKILLGFNEPEVKNQANLSVSEAIQLWKQYIIPATAMRPIRLGSPAISNGLNGLPWLKEFMEECDQCQIDFIACHWYGYDFNSFKTQIETIHKAFPDKKIWVTEFALQVNALAKNQMAFFDQASSYLDKASFIERYAWYGAFRGNLGNALINISGKLTDLGIDYESRVNFVQNMDNIDSNGASSDSSDDGNNGYDDFLGLY